MILLTGLLPIAGMKIGETKGSSKSKEVITNVEYKEMS
jgi:hypothetical protein